MGHSRVDEVDYQGLHVPLTSINEDLRQPFRLADHNHVTGIDLDERLNTTEGVNVFALQLRREGTIPPSQNSGAGNVVGHSPSRHLLYEHAQ